jgi:hypothetical protein
VAQRRKEVSLNRRSCYFPAKAVDSALVGDVP